jgi:CxxC motif-containing protein (DUF1111 family)
MRPIAYALVLASAACVAAPVTVPPPPPLPDAPAGLDGESNGLVDSQAHLADTEAFGRVEEISSGLGPLYNAQSCSACHQNPVAGAASQMTELRAGHRDAAGRFVPPRIPIAGGTVIVEGRTLVNDRAICPSAAFPDQEIQERVPDVEVIRARRLSVSLLGDGYVEAVPDGELEAIALRQCRESGGRICGLVVMVPVLEAPGAVAAGRFGWKDQQASLLSFAGDAYLNEIGITNRLLPTEVTTICDTVQDPEDVPDAEGLADIDRFARFARATQAPSRDAHLAAADSGRRGSALFDQVGCATCHVRTLTTAAPGTKLLGGTYTVTPAIGDKSIHPYGDFLLHDVGTGDGIVMSVVEHHGRAFLHMQPTFDVTANRIRTAPLWGLRLRPRLMHDGESLTLRDAISRHRHEAKEARVRFEKLDPEQQADLLSFLLSL